MRITKTLEIPESYESLTSDVPHVGITLEQFRTFDVPAFRSNDYKTPDTEMLCAGSGKPVRWHVSSCYGNTSASFRCTECDLMQSTCNYVEEGKTFPYAYANLPLMFRHYVRKMV